VPIGREKFGIQELE